MLDEEPCSGGKEYHWQNRPVSDWTSQQVCHWLMGMNMDQYTPEFSTQAIDGQQLLNLDSDRLKVKTFSNLTTWHKRSLKYIWFIDILNNGNTLF